MHEDSGGFITELFHGIQQSAEQQIGSTSKQVYVAHISEYDPARGMVTVINPLNIVPPALSNQADPIPQVSEWIPLYTLFGPQSVVGPRETNEERYGWQYYPLGGSTPLNPTAGEMVLVLSLYTGIGYDVGAFMVFNNNSLPAGGEIPISGAVLKRGELLQVTPNGTVEHYDDQGNLKTYVQQVNDQGGNIQTIAYGGITLNTGSSPDEPPSVDVGDIDLRAAADVNAFAAVDVNIDAGQDINASAINVFVDAALDVEIEAGDDITMNAVDAVDIGGNTIDATATTTLDLTAGTTLTAQAQNVGIGATQDISLVATDDIGLTAGDEINIAAADVVNITATAVTSLTEPSRVNAGDVNVTASATFGTAGSSLTNCGNFNVTAGTTATGHTGAQATSGNINLLAQATGGVGTQDGSGSVHLSATANGGAGSQTNSANIQLDTHKSGNNDPDSGNITLDAAQDTRLKADHAVVITTDDLPASTNSNSVFITNDNGSAPATDIIEVAAKTDLDLFAKQDVGIVSQRDTLIDATRDVTANAQRNILMHAVTQASLQGDAACTISTGSVPAAGTNTVLINTKASPFTPVNGSVEVVSLNSIGLYSDNEISLQSDEDIDIGTYSGGSIEIATNNNGIIQIASIDPTNASVNINAERVITASGFDVGTLIVGQATVLLSQFGQRTQRLLTESFWNDVYKTHTHGGVTTGLGLTGQVTSQGAVPNTDAFTQHTRAN